MFEKVFLVFLIVAAIIFIYWLNKRLNLELGSELLGDIANLESSQKKEIERLKERVAVLERIVTDSGSQLSAKIDRL
ncbi:hypothetical protein FLL45_21760 [Aliikangiella marina]|uniref:Uncharacterized protein n=1 Tax=Aliikangiella marina TaxID=1712262 RepID=A0A545T158_9GAMM|nr:hypothetical protein [Aliikangiella marina]TQV70956.1 hypothetical protein FLL45_21760 [Aliikangiella marina]